MLRSDLSEKPSFQSIKNLKTILSDKGPSFEPGTLNYMFNGSMNNVRQLLFQKRNGDFYLMVWTEVSIWDVHAKVDIYPLPQPLVLTLQEKKRISDVTLYAFDNDANVNIIQLTINNNQVAFNATDKISIIKLSNNTNFIFQGIYRFTPKNALHSCLDSNNSNHTTVDQSYYRDEVNQQWIVQPVNDGFYRLTNRGSGRVLGADSCYVSNRGVVQLYDWLDFDCQKWKFELLINGFYRIAPKHAQNQCLDIKLLWSTSGTKVQQWSWLNHDSQHWKLDWITSVI